MPYLQNLKIKGVYIHEIAYKVAIVVILLLFSILLIFTAVNSYMLSLNASQNILEGRALSISVNIRITIEKLGIRHEIFPEFMDKDTNGDIAFIALYNKSGKTVMHTNPQMVNRPVEDQDFEEFFEKDRPQKYKMKLATGENVFVMDFPMQFDADINNKNKDKDNKYCLRIALHPSFSMFISRQAFAGMVFIFISIIILWSLAFMVYQNMKKRERLKVLLNEKQRLAALGEMASVLAHEIRNPLSSIKGFAQFHLERTVDKILYEDLKVIVEETGRLERLTSNLLDYARPLKLFKKRFSLKYLCEILKKELGAVPVGITMHFECEFDDIYGDREKFLQILINLIHNSISALEEKGGEIWISVTKKEGKIYINVRDNGPGFAQNILEKIFEPFVTTKAKGVGLGLAIVKRLTREMNGEIHAENLEECGASVTIIIKDEEEPLKEDV
jgi:two-component system sensor histidine kinase HydH